MILEMLVTETISALNMAGEVQDYSDHPLMQDPALPFKPTKELVE
jgi:hypothetical protein